MLRAQLSQNSPRERLATRGFAEAYTGYFSAHLADKIAGRAMLDA